MAIKGDVSYEVRFCYLIPYMRLELHVYMYINLYVYQLSYSEISCNLFQISISKTQNLILQRC